jgi:cyclopropane-fatty-acyl-phospholipid synthase
MQIKVESWLIGKLYWLIRVEQSKTAYFLDFLAYLMTISALSLYLVWVGFPNFTLIISFLVIVGFISWTLIEYLLHRYLLHGVEPFKQWHIQHHSRPTALICTPTLVSSGAIGLFIFIPAWLVWSLWIASALTLGLLIGYLGYAITHHALHHWRARGNWLTQRKVWHFRHHANQLPICYGVTSGYWDTVFNSEPKDSLIHHSSVN